MKIITQRDVIKNVAETWKEAFYSKGVWFSPEKEKERVYEALKALPENATAEQVRQITGCYGWGEILCGECWEEVNAVVILDDGDGHEFKLCLDCLEKAAQALREVEK